MGGRRKIRNEDLHGFCSSPDVIRLVKTRRLKSVEHVADMGNKVTVYRVLVEKSEGNIPLGRPKHRWEDNIKMCVKMIGWEGVYWVHLAQDRDSFS
jgi:hypothetical protein